jgi:hypothetical protein
LPELSNHFYGQVLTGTGTKEGQMWVLRPAIPATQEVEIQTIKG